jgi:hypothetical protein
MYIWSENSILEPLLVLIDIDIYVLICLRQILWKCNGGETLTVLFMYFVHIYLCIYWCRRTKNIQELHKYGIYVYLCTYKIYMYTILYFTDHKLCFIRKKQKNKLVPVRVLNKSNLKIWS